MAFGKFGRYRPDGDDVRVELIDVAALIRRAVSELDADGRVVLTLSEPLEIASDPLHVSYLVANLLQNALKYSPDGSPVHVSGNSAPRAVLVAVRDEGIGIPETEREQLFSPFYRASNVAGRPGTGMGLSIVKKSAGLIGASVELDSAEGEGSVFTVTLPRDPVDWR